MTKADAIEKAREIQGGAGVDRDKYLKLFGAGEIAVDRWNKPDFTLGIEYGYLIALAETFNLTPEDFNIKL